MIRYNLIVVLILLAPPMALISQTDENCWSQAHNKPNWRLKISLDAPSLASPAVHFVIFDHDPVPEFSAAIKKMRDSFRKQLCQAPDSAQREIIRNAQMITSWNQVFDGVETKFASLSPASTPRLFIASSEPANRKWIVTKTAMLKRESHIVCWSLPVEVKVGKILPITLSESNCLRLDSIYEQAMEAINERM